MNRPILEEEAQGIVGATSTAAAGCCANEETKQ